MSVHSLSSSWHLPLKLFISSRYKPSWQRTMASTLPAMQKCLAHPGLRITDFTGKFLLNFDYLKIFSHNARRNPRIMAVARCKQPVIVDRYRSTLRQQPHFWPAFPASSATCERYRLNGTTDPPPKTKHQHARGRRLSKYRSWPAGTVRNVFSAE